MNPKARSNFVAKHFIDYIEKIVLENSEDSENQKLKNSLVEFFVTKNVEKNLRNVANLVSDLMFVLPVIQQIFLRNQIGQKSFLFYEKYAREEAVLVPGVQHSNELFYIFDKERGNFNFDENDKKFQNHLCQGFVNFVKFGYVLTFLKF